jgi:hypothetical protein
MQRSLKKAAVIMTALTLAAMMGCEMDSGADSGSDSGGLRFQAAIDGAQSRAVGQAWSAGDAIGISMLKSGGSDPVGSVSNRKFVTTDGKGAFDPADGQKISVSEKADLFAYYPYASPMTGFTYPVDVSDQENQEKIDLMTAKVEGIEPNTDLVNLNFQHKLSAVGLTVKPGDGVSVTDLANVEAEITGQTVRGTYDVKANTFSPSAAAGDLNMSLKFKMSADMSGGAKSGEAVILPASGGTNREMIIVLHTGTAKVIFTKSIPNDYAFSPGVRHQFPLKLSRDPASSTGYKAEGGFAGTIEDWQVKTEKEETIEGKEIQNPGGGSGDGGGTTPNPTPTPNPISKYIVNPIVTPVGGKGYELKGSYKDNNFDCWLLYLGKIKDVPMDNAVSFNYPGDRDITRTFTWSHSSKEGFADTISETAAKTINTTHENSATFKIEVGIEGKVEFPGVASVKESLKESLAETFKNSTTTSISSTIEKTAQQYTEWTSSEGESLPWPLYKDSDPAGYYRMSLFAQCDVYVTLLQSRDDKTVYYNYEVVPIKTSYNRRMEYSPPDNSDFSKDIPQLPFDLNWVKNPEFVSSGPVKNITNIDSSYVTGKSQYNYEARQTGYITVTLVGGGGGGSGAVAVRDYSNDRESIAQSGSGAQGGDTKLYVRNSLTDALTATNLKLTATGGAGGTGRSKQVNGNWIGDEKFAKEDGAEGTSATPTASLTIQVYKGDIITINVGSGGGGSGGAANNDNGGYPSGKGTKASSTTADGTAGTAGNTQANRGCYADASSGGNGASGTSKNGGNSSAAGSASGVSGGQGKGAGGKGGKAVTSGNVYASGGGGGAAGGFTLQSDKVELLERL